MNRTKRLLVISAAVLIIICVAHMIAVNLTPRSRYLREKYGDMLYVTFSGEPKYRGIQVIINREEHENGVRAKTRYLSFDGVTAEKISPDVTAEVESTRVRLTMRITNSSQQPQRVSGVHFEEFVFDEWTIIVNDFLTSRSPVDPIDIPAGGVAECEVELLGHKIPRHTDCRIVLELDGGGYAAAEFRNDE